MKDSNARASRDDIAAVMQAIVRLHHDCERWKSETIREFKQHAEKFRDNLNRARPVTRTQRLGD